MNRRILTVIPARGGSKGLPGKNIRLLGGKPLIAWAIDKAAEVGARPCIVSTDDKEIAETARLYGGDVPFLRPASLGTDSSTLLQVNHHALKYFDDLGEHFDAVLTIHVTAPLISSAIVKEVIDTFHTTGAQCVATVTRIRHGHPMQAKRLLQDGTLQEYISGSGDTTRYSRQQREPLYYPNCGVYLRDRCLVEAMDRSTNGLGPSPVAIVVPPEQSIDIDDELDFLLAEAIVSSGHTPRSSQ